MPVPAYVQSVSSAPANTTSVTLTLNGVLTGNNVLVCVDATSGFDSYSVSDGVNSYVSVLGPITSPPNNQFGQWFLAKNVTGGNLTITVTTSISTTHFAAAVEVSGIDPTTPIQSTDFAGAQNTSNALGNATATSKANTLAIAMTTAYGLGGVPVSQTLDAAWTQRENIAFAAGTPHGSGAVGTQLVVTSGNTAQANSTLSHTASWLALTLLLNPVVAATLVSIAITPTTASINPGGATKQYTAIGTYSDSSTADITSTVTWASSAPSKATIASSGLATSVAAGVTTITASLSGITSNSATLTVLSLVSIAITPTNSSIDPGGAIEQFTATATFSDASTSNITSLSAWTTSTPGVATINSSGLATSVADGVTTVSALWLGVNSNPATLIVATTITLNGAFQLANTARVANGSVSFALRECHNASGAQLFPAGTPVVTQLDSNGAFSVVLETFDNLVIPTPYAMVVYDAQGKFLMERIVYFSGSGNVTLNDVPVQNDGTAFPTQYPGDTGYRLIQGGFGSLAANGSVTFELYQQAVVAASSVEIVPTPLTYQLDGSGNLPAGVYLYLSAALAPYTVYLVTVFDSTGGQISKLMYSLSETAPAICNLNDLSASATAAGVGYSNIPGSLWAAIPWLKS